jgi:hypothetical protein
VVEPTGYFDSGLASHRSVRLSLHFPNVNISCLTPPFKRGVRGA